MSLGYPEVFYIPVGPLYPGFFPQILSLGGISGLVHLLQAGLEQGLCEAAFTRGWKDGPEHPNPHSTTVHLLKEKKNVFFTTEAFLCLLE